MNKTPAANPQRKCSYCGEVFTVTDLQVLPFCSRRCKEVDLSNWLTESYGLPFEGDPDEESEQVKRNFFGDEMDI